MLGVSLAFLLFYNIYTHHADTLHIQQIFIHRGDGCVRNINYKYKNKNTMCLCLAERHAVQISPPGLIE